MENDPKGVMNNKHSVSLRFDLRIVTAVLLIVIVAMLALWHPWSAAASSSARTISVTGDATVTATPDEYVFNPSYQFKETDKDTAIKKVSSKQAEVVNGLKKLGVTDSQIKANSGGYNYYFDDTSNTYDYTLSLTVTVNDATRSQKVQDYLVASSPDGQISPTAEFSNAKQKLLESQARDQATKEARAKAEQSAKNLGFRVGAVKSVEDGEFGGVNSCGRGFMCPLSAAAVPGDTKATTSLSVQPGQNDLDYSVTVVYYLR